VGDEREPWLSELLDAAATEYTPDTERMRALVAARIAEQRDEAGASSASAPRSRRRARRTGGLGLAGRLGLAGIPASVALATFGTAAALAVGATATIAVTSQHHRPGGSVPTPAPGGSAPGQSGTGAKSASPSPSPTGAPSPPPTATGSSGHPAASSSSTSPSPTPSAPATDTASSVLVGAAASIDSGSNAGWAQLDLNVSVKQPLTALDVTVKVSNCTGLAGTGAWDSGATGQFTETATSGSDGSITYEFQLTAGDEVSPGTVAFAVQFNHASTGWNVADDTYYVSARTATSTSADSAHGAY